MPISLRNTIVSMPRGQQRSKIASKISFGGTSISFGGTSISLGSQDFNLWISMDFRISVTEIIGKILLLGFRISEDFSICAQNDLLHKHISVCVRVCVCVRACVRAWHSCRSKCHACKHAVPVCHVYING